MRLESPGCFSPLCVVTQIEIVAHEQFGVAACSFAVASRESPAMKCYRKTWFLVATHRSDRWRRPEPGNRNRNRCWFTVRAQSRSPPPSLCGAGPWLVGAALGCAALAARAGGLLVRAALSAGRGRSPWVRSTHLPPLYSPTATGTAAQLGARTRRTAPPPTWGSAAPPTACPPPAKRQEQPSRAQEKSCLTRAQLPATGRASHVQIPTEVRPCLPPTRGTACETKSLTCIRVRAVYCTSRAWCPV